MEIDIPEDDYFYEKFNIKCQDFVRAFPAAQPNCRLGDFISSIVNATHLLRYIHTYFLPIYYRITNSDIFRLLLRIENAFQHVDWSH